MQELVIDDLSTNQMKEINFMMRNPEKKPIKV